MVEQTVPRTGLPNPKSNSATGNLRPEDTTSAGPPCPSTIFDSISPGLWHSIQSIKSRKQQKFGQSMGHMMVADEHGGFSDDQVHMRWASSELFLTMIGETYQKLLHHQVRDRRL